MKGSQDVCPLDHLSQRSPFQHFWAKNIPRLLSQEAHMHQDLKEKDSREEN